MRNGNLIFFVGLLLILGMAFLTPVEAHAINDVNVNIRDGKLNIGGAGFDEADSDGAWNTIISQYRGFIVGVSGIGAITMLAIFIFMFLKLGASAGNPQARSQALTGLMWSGIATAGLGSVALIVGLFYNLLN